MRLPWLRVAVRGHSMIPALAPGDHVIVRRGAPARPGRIVVVDRAERRIVKRVTHLTADGGVWVQGDNDAVTDDSRTFGAVDAADVVGEVRWRYYPFRHAGRVR